MTDPLLKPIRLGSMMLKNRVFSAAHEPSYSEDGLPQDRYRRYHEEKAKGGIALTIIGGSATVSVDSPGTFGNLDVSSDRIIKAYQSLSDSVHAFDCKVFTQLTHLGARSTWAGKNWLPLISASSIRETGHRTFAKEAEPEDLARVASDFAQAARRARDGGLDGIEIMSHSHLIGAFINPAENRRTDEYGGSAFNRTRLCRQVLETIRHAVGDDFVVGVRVGLNNMHRRSYALEGGMEVIKHLVETGLVDFLNVNVGSGINDVGRARLIPPMGTPFAPYLDQVKNVKDAFGLPVLHSGRIPDVASARMALDSGSVDLVGMTRAHMADPHIVSKIVQGEEHRIRPCVGSGYCIDQIYTAGAAYCIHNVSTGREAQLPHIIKEKSASSKKIVIVGGGPAGLEAARVCALRGREVHLFEAASDLGGQLLLAAKAPGRMDMLGIVDWLATEAVSAGAHIQTNYYVEAPEIEALDPNIVLIATGGIPNLPMLDAGGDLVTNSWDILSGQVAPGDQVLVYDENGREPGVSAASYLIEKGAKVEFVTPDRHVAPEVGSINYPGFLRRFYKGGATVTPDHKLIGIERQGNGLRVHLYNEYSDEPTERLVKQVVVEYGTEAVLDVYSDLKAQSRNGGQYDLDALAANTPQYTELYPEGRFDLFRLGDALASRNLHAALLDARRLCMTL